MDKIKLKIMRCPTCGGSLKAENNTDQITCVYCGNTIVPVTEPVAPAASDANPGVGVGASVRVEGIKTASSALAYTEQFFEEYDWDAFAYAQTLTVGKIDALAAYLRDISADDKNTWFVCFKAVCIPYLHKVEGCRAILDSVIAEYKKDNLDAYSKFDAYKRIASIIANSRDDVVEKLNKIVSYAVKYGASPEEKSELESDVLAVKKTICPDLYKDIESIPAIRSFIDEKNTKIARDLAERGIDAESEYSRAKSLVAAARYTEALRALLDLNGYSDSAALVSKLDRYYLISDVLEIDGTLYYFKKEDKAQDSVFDLYPTVDGRIGDKPIVKKIGKIISNFANILYYLDSDNVLKSFDLSSGVEEKKYNRKILKDKLFMYDRCALMLTGSGYGGEKHELVALALATGQVNVLLDDVKDVLSLTGDKLVYTAGAKSGDSYNTKIVTRIINVNTLSVTEIGEGTIPIAGFVDGCAVYTVNAPNKVNKDIMIKPLGSSSPARTLEKNIYDFCDIIAGKVFYYVGNSGNRSLININCDGTDRKELPLFISKILFEQGGWLYFIRSAGYNSVLCKSRIDGGKFSVIASDIDKFIEIKNGYLYYINSGSTLVKVRMDGSNLQELCDDVESVLAVKEDKILFVSIDDRVTVGDYPNTSVKTVKSIYAVEFSGSGKIKLAYDVGAAKEYDDNTVYFIASSTESDRVDVLYKIDVPTNRGEKLLDIKKPEPSGGCYVATCVYGSYDCPEVWTLRRYRDDVLAATWYGRAFVRAYYAISPTVVRLFGETEWFRRFWRGRLDEKVEALNEAGFEATPYEDRQW